MNLTQPQVSQQRRNFPATRPPLRSYTEVPPADPPHVVLVGNPNTGKSTIFNALTGADQSVSNWTGTTVAGHRGAIRGKGGTAVASLVDLPGAYSLTPYSEEERITRDYLLEQPVDLVVNVVDAANPERNLYLTLQLLETGLPILVVLNKLDLSTSRGKEIDEERLSHLLGVPVLKTVADRSRGILELKRAILEPRVCDDPHATGRVFTYPDFVGAEIDRLISVLAGRAQPRDSGPATGRLSLRWRAVQLLEDLTPMPADADPAVTQAVEDARRRLTARGGTDVDLVMADTRYESLSTIIAATVTVDDERALETAGDRADRILAHPWWGPVVFLAIMYVVFNLVQRLSAPFVDWIDAVINGALADGAGLLLAATRTPAWMDSLIVDGVIAGVGGVLVFLPSLFAMYLALGLLEESGYMARAAFVMDRFLSHFGLNGKSFVPLILGFGCNVPAIYATRTIESHSARLLTALLVPFMSCTARLPVYVIFAMAFFPQNAGSVVWGLYILGMIVAAGVAAVLSRILFTDEVGGILIMELPAYRRPAARELIRRAAVRSRSFVRKAGTVILAMAVLLWVLLHLPAGVEEPRDSLYGAMSATVAPLFGPAGFDRWEASAALISGVMAKEVVVATLAQVLAGPGVDAAAAAGTAAGSMQAATSWVLETADTVVLGAFRASWQAVMELLEILTPGFTLFAAGAEATDPTLSTALQQAFTPLSGLAFLVFVALYVPCIATIGALRDEFGGRWAAFGVGLTVVVPWIAAVGVYQIGRLFGWQ